MKKDFTVREFEAFVESKYTSALKFDMPASHRYEAALKVLNEFFHAKVKESRIPKVGEFVLTEGQWYVVDTVGPEAVWASDKDGADHYISLIQIEDIQETP